MTKKQPELTSDIEQMNAALKRMLNTPPKHHKAKSERDKKQKEQPKK
jgi:hypothetical protein